MNKILNIAAWIALIVGTVVLLGFTHQKQEMKTCKKINISIDRTDETYFVDEEEIYAMVYHEVDSGGNRYLADIDLEKVEKQLNNHPSISNVEVYRTINGEMRIDVEQRKPIVRIFNLNGESYYMDDDGIFMPPSSNYTARVMVANGHLFEPYEKVYQLNAKEIMKNDSIRVRSRLDDIFLFADYINKDPFWKAQIEQLYVNKEFEIELIPRVGNHTIVFGDATRLNEKFNNLMIFYKKGLNKTGWNEYSTINLKYKDQVICTKI